MLLAKALRDEEFNRVSEHFVMPIARHGLQESVRVDDMSYGIHDDDAVWEGLEQTFDRDDGQPPPF